MKYREEGSGRRISDFRGRNVAAADVVWCGGCAYTGVMSSPSETRHERLHVRLSPTDDGLIRAAAQAANLSLTEFVLRAARASAAHTLAERDHVVLDADTWDRLDARVGESGKRNAKVVDLFARPAPSKG